MTYEIIKDKPLPKRKCSQGRPKGESKYPFDKMNIGDCFMVITYKKPNRNLASLAKSWAKTHKLYWKFTSRSKKLENGTFENWLWRTN